MRGHFFRKDPKQWLQSTNPRKLIVLENVLKYTNVEKLEINLLFSHTFVLKKIMLPNNIFD